MYNQLAARVLVILGESANDSLLVFEAPNWILRKVPASLKTKMVYKVQVEILDLLHGESLKELQHEKV